MKNDKRYFKSKWDDTRGDEWDNWGTSMWYFEIGKDGYPTRQITVYENGKRLKYSEALKDDHFGGLGDQSIDEAEFRKQEIDRIEFEKEWKQ